MNEYLNYLQDPGKFQRDKEDRARIKTLQEEEIAYYKEQRTFLAEQKTATATMKVATVWIAIAAIVQALAALFIGYLTFIASAQLTERMPASLKVPPTLAQPPAPSSLPPVSSQHSP